MCYLSILLLIIIFRFLIFFKRLRNCVLIELGRHFDCVCVLLMNEYRRVNDSVLLGRGRVRRHGPEKMSFVSVANVYLLHMYLLVVYHGSRLYNTCYVKKNYQHQRMALIIDVEIFFSPIETY